MEIEVLGMIEVMRVALQLEGHWRPQSLRMDLKPLTWESTLTSDLIRIPKCYPNLSLRMVVVDWSDSVTGRIPLSSFCHTMAQPLRAP